MNEDTYPVCTSREPLTLQEIFELEQALVGFSPVTFKTVTVKLGMTTGGVEVIRGLPDPECPTRKLVDD